MSATGESHFYASFDQPSEGAAFETDTGARPWMVLDHATSKRYPKGYYDATTGCVWFSAYRVNENGPGGWSSGWQSRQSFERALSMGSDSYHKLCFESEDRVSFDDHLYLHPKVSESSSDLITQRSGLKCGESHTFKHLVRGLRDSSRSCGQELVICKTLERDEECNFFVVSESSRVPVVFNPVLHLFSSIPTEGREAMPENRHTIAFLSSYYLFNARHLTIRGSTYTLVE